MLLVEVRLHGRQVVPNGGHLRTFGCSLQPLKPPNPETPTTSTTPTTPLSPEAYGPKP